MKRLKLALSITWLVVAPLFAYAARRLSPPAASRQQQKTKSFADDVDYRRDVEPILRAACFRCHTGEKAKAQLRMDDPQAFARGGASGPAFVAGDGAKSLLIERITTTDQTIHMPPGGASLAPAQVAALRAWVDQGAKFEAAAKVAQSPSPADAQKASQPQTTSQLASAAAIDFARDVQPILRENCYACHAGEKAKAQLRLDAKAGALARGGISGAVIVPNKSADSRLIHRVLGQGGEQRMPLGGTPLSDAQIATLRRWIDEGAAWPDDGSSTQTAALAKHWAYVAPAHDQALPAVKDSAWVRNPIDNFVLARLEKEKLRPSPEASREKLLRRVSLDLIGLPPTPDEVDAFVADRSPDAYEKVVDRLLGSPHYGERWARPWLDLARYADTNGYEKDRRRSIWKYRDWVIDAFNRDLPFDQFTVQQIAGDMLPAAATPEQSDAQKIATGFHRNAMLNEEGGVDPEEARWETMVDRAGTTATVWLGSTMACAQCHNHKYDPFTQKEFYQLLAFFDNTEYQLIGPADISEQKLVEPKLELPTPEQNAKRSALQAKLDALQKTYAADTAEIAGAQKAWEREVVAAETEWVPLRPTQLATADKSSTITPENDGSLIVGGANPVNTSYTIEARTNLRGITAVRLEALADERLPRGGPGRDVYGNFLLSGFSVEIAPAGGGGSGVRFAPIEFKGALADDQMRNMRPSSLLADKYQKPSDLSSRAADATPPVGWQIDATRDAKRLNRQAVFAAAAPFGSEGETLLKIKLTHNSDFAPQGLGKFRLSVTDSSDPLRVARVTARLRPLLGVPDAQRTAEQRRGLSDYFRSATPLLEATRDQIASCRKELDELGIVSTLVMQERSSFERPATNLRVRGSFTNVGEKVYAGVPAALHQFPESQLPNRLGLARWLVDEKNPLTARVTVNRLWEQIFGRGIVETSEDFGAQGAAPSHPELLDWLAVDFVSRQKWSVKKTLRAIVTSATYRQDSRATKELLERDPANKWLARGPRFRLEAEAIRDVALHASGLLRPQIGGPSVFPYQPDGIWSLPYNDDRWQQSAGADRFRRGLYTFWRRTSPYPSFATFDATSREFCTVRRVRTNTPLQALVTLNDPTFFETARGLARRIAASDKEESGDKLSRLMTYGFGLCTARAPRPAEVERLRALYEEQAARFKKDAQAAQKVLGEEAIDADRRAELAAWTIVANVLLNLDETVTKE